MHKKLTIIAVTAILMISYAAVGITGYESDAASDEYNYIGFGGKLSAEQALVMVLQEYVDDDDLGFDDDLLDNPNLTFDDIKKMLGITYNIDKFEIGGSVELWFDAKYNSDEMYMAFAASGSFSIGISMVNKIDPNKKIVFEDFTVTLLANGNISYALQKDTTGSIYVNTTGGILFDGKTNMMFDDDDMEFGKTVKPFEYSMAFACDVNVTFPTSETFEKAKAQSGTPVKVNVNINGSYGFATDIVDNLPSLVSYTSASKEMTIKYENDEGYELSIGKIRGIELPLTATDKEELNEEIEDMEEDVPSALLIGNSIKITKAKYDEISSNIEELKSKTDSKLTKLDISVTYLDANGSELSKKTVPFGTPIPYIEYNGNVPEGKSFVGWAPDKAITVKGSYIALGNIEMHPVFATVAEPGDINTILATDNIVVVTIDVNNTVDIPLDKISKDKSIIIEIKNGTEIISKWSISGDASEGSIKNLKLGVSIETNPASVDGVANGKKSIYLNFEANGKMPSESSISYNVSGTYNDGTSVEIYHVEGDKVSKVGERTVSNGFVDIPTSGFSGYFIQEIGSESESDDSFPVYAVVAVVAVAIIAVAAVVIIRKH